MATTTLLVATPAMATPKPPLRPRFCVIDDDFSDIEEDDDTGSSASVKESAGLAAAELREEKLYPGDTIEYFSMAFVFGDPRGHHIAKVLQVAHDETQYPIRLDTQELLPSTQMIRRKRDRHGEEIEAGGAVWRKIRTFELVDGQIKGKTRADVLNETIKRAEAEAFNLVHKASSKDKAAKDKPIKAISSFFKPAPKSQPPAKRSESDTHRDRERRKAASPSREVATSDRPLAKRPRIDLSPPNRSGKQGRITESFFSTMSDSKKERRESSGPRNGDSKHKHGKVRLQAFVDSVEEKAKPRLERDRTPGFISKKRKKSAEEAPLKDLNSYMDDYDRKKREAEGRRHDELDDDDDDFEQSNAEREHKKKKKKKSNRPASISQWMRSAQPQKERRFVQPKHSNPDKPVAERLSFIMDSEPPSPPTDTPRRQIVHQRSPGSVKRSEGNRSATMDTWVGRR